ncbi:MAG: DNA-directed RNA polymerase subunit A' [Candidatus Woesearchaeota archaeon]|nr:MAG: DNA-directed RNA polymerase subunit A' [Candidatus Woesearchaeota archaeon]
MSEDYVYKKIKSIIFSFMSPKNIKKMATAKIVTSELYDKEGYPVDGGLMDTRLGVIDPGFRCKICGGKLKECMGHFGYIELARPVIHINYVKKILDTLRCTCVTCGRILLDDEIAKKYREEIKEALAKETAELARLKVRKVIEMIKGIKKCPHCKEKQYSVKIEKPTTFTENDKRLSPIEVRARLERVPDEDIYLLGLVPEHARPEWMVLTILPIPPVTMRPSITLETGERSEDDLTHKLGDIVRINQRLFENINAGAPEIIIEDLWDLLQYHVTTYFDNDLAQVPPTRHRSGQPLKTLAERIKSKEGRFRHNLAGKRVNFSGRTVISPDPKIELEEVGVPLIVAMELTIPEKVNEWNIDWLKAFIKNGPHTYPGANYVITPDNKKKKITNETKEPILAELTPGYTVERHLLDGDISIFNRQPSLHRMSIMCHKVKVLPGKSFRLNPSVCTPYNADFDGDEMNIHIPQTEEARTEAEALMAVRSQFITPKSGYNIISAIQDSISGNYILTKESEYTKEEVAQLLISIGVEDLPTLKNRMNGKEIFSLLLPKDFSFIGTGKDGKSVVFRNGKLEEGIIDVNSIGVGTGDLLRNLHNYYGQEKAIEILNNIAKLGIAVLLKDGFSTGIADTDLPAETWQQVQDLLKKAEAKGFQLLDDFKNKEIEAFPGRTVQETVELRIMEALNKVRDQIGNLISDQIDETNHSIIMAKSGARGKILNVTMMSACVGQQALRGKRIEIGYRGRTLSLFKKGDLSPLARGFIARGYKQGLTPQEFFFGAMTGRDSLMDTALRTPKSGYLYRRLANALQDLKIEYDNTVRDANENIVQFKYGDDGIDVSRSHGGTINVKKIIKEVKGGIHG